MTEKKNDILIYFNDALVATTSSIISYEREFEDQKEYRFLNTVSELSATIFCNDLKIIPNENIQIEIL
ncbi:MAG: hypothetical protein PF638_11000 [Candidatus Delongbacteria bacterium]|jgi:hypothetical protein|nr:hypothetical protein [Candidatus Delongbacteria bacterium]